MKHVLRAAALAVAAAAIGPALADDSSPITKKNFLALLCLHFGLIAPRTRRSTRRVSNRPAEVNSRRSSFCFGHLDRRGRNGGRFRRFQR